MKDEMAVMHGPLALPATAQQTTTLPAPNKARNRRPEPARKPLRLKPKDSREQLRTSRTRGLSVESSSTNATSSRSYVVANIAPGGVLYLRPAARSTPIHQSRDPFTQPPSTPPDSATLDTGSNRRRSNDWEHSLYSSRRKEPHNVTDAAPLPHSVKSATPPRTHARSRSFSTADEHTISTQSIEPGSFKVIIERPTTKRPNTADTTSLPLLSVPIPNYRLGTPRFSARGTAILRSSIYTRTSGPEDSRSSIFTPHRPAQSFLSSRRHSEVFSPLSANYRTTMDQVALQASTAPNSARVSRIAIGPQLYDALTMNPDDHAVVRFSASGEILAATPSRLVAHITSPSFLDYELLSDFFLTFRSFLTARDLVAYLISRLRWAVDRQDDFGRIVRVRTFVALRHWILNYFVDDFVPAYQLRVYFCELVNSLYRDLKARADGGGGDIKIVGELKKCWRRTCALYWDDTEGVGKDSTDYELLPGGQPAEQATSQVSADDVAVVPSTPPRQMAREAKVETIGSNPSDHFASKHMDWALRARHTPQNSLSSPYIPSQDYDGVQIPLSPASEQSMQVLSCSIPMRGLTRAATAGATKDVPLYPHPVPHPVQTRVAATPQHSVSINRTNKPTHGHKRSGSFSDALRDNRAPLPLPKNPAPDATISAVSKMPGSLVRGGLIQPGSPYVDHKNGGMRHTRSQLELDTVDSSTDDIQIRSGQATNPGVKKLLGSVRRALSSKHPSASSPYLANIGQHAMTTPPTRASNPTTISTVSGGVQKRRAQRPRVQVRMDVLAARVAESFTEAVKEELQTQRQRQSSMPGLSGFEFEFEKRRSPSSEETPKAQRPPAERIYSNVTNGSRSIVIMDDTRPPLPLMSGALPTSDDEKSSSKTAMPLEDQPDLAVDKVVVSEEAPATRHSELYEDVTPKESLEWRRTSRDSIQRSFSTKRRSMSEGRQQMHSFRRRGSRKSSMARGSLRRHASHNSGLTRRDTTASMATTVQTMSSDNDPFFLDRQPSKAAVGPTRQLRRRPGGDLRAADNIHDLEHCQRPHSTGSLSNRTHSIANSVILRSDRYVEPTKDTTADHEASPETEKKAVSLMNTHSSQPNLRPSFEVEVAKLAALPDDTDDDGGIESALMKLEGRYEKKSPDPSPRITIEPDVYRPTGAPAESSHPSYVFSEQDSSMNTQSNARSDGALHRPLAPPEGEGQGMFRLSSENFNRRPPGVHSAVESEDSYSSIPLLDRGLSEITTSNRTRTQNSMRSSAMPAPLNTQTSAKNLQDNLRQRTSHLVLSPDSSVEYVTETESMKRIPADGSLPVPKEAAPRESFLLDEDEDLSDLSDDDGTMLTRSDSSHGVRSFFDDEPAADEVEQGVLPTHPMRHPPTPPLTANKLNDPMPLVDTTVFERGLPTPGLTPTFTLNSKPFEQPKPASQPIEPPTEMQEMRKTETRETASPPAHLPFVLAYDSEILAQQFTIVEKDALDEIDWKELIELRWKQSSPKIKDWVHYLRTEEPRGVDVVIARFNLVVKWAVSECVLTENVEERARCIVKYIHIATHARRLRNYATMYQLSIALLSADVSRLKRTWALVPAAEQQTMKELEQLVQPLKNFHNLRVEMETATVEEGCIPFIGIYTRDLIYNAQKPLFINAPPVDGEKLVNFERHHTAAMIVKSLLRLLEASSKYTFKAEPNIIGKCLWMAALDDEEITKLSRQLE